MGCIFRASHYRKIHKERMHYGGQTNFWRKNNFSV